MREKPRKAGYLHVGLKINGIASPDSMKSKMLKSNATAVIVLALSISSLAIAQRLPAPSRTAYKCEVNGKVTYSDAPCLGAEKVDLQPTRGMNKASGRELVGRDVAREHQREQFADAIRPITGLDAKGLDMAGRRQKLSIEIQRECEQLDKKISDAERAEKQSTKAQLSQAQASLLKLRASYRQYGC